MTEEFKGLQKEERGWAIKEYLELCEQKHNELGIANKEIEKITIPPKTDFLANTSEMDLIKKYFEEKDGLLRTALITLFKSNSVIIPEVLSIRNGEFRRYRGQYKLELQEVKKIIYEYCNYLKLTEEEKEILDFCLKLVNHEDYDEYRGLRDVNNRWENKKYKLEKRYYLFDKDSDNFKAFKIIELYPDGKIEFKDDSDDESYPLSIRYRTSGFFEDEQISMLIYHFQDEIRGMKESFDKELIDIRIKLESEIKIIREKCGKYLLVASLRSSE